jgi:hypothetical protein
MAKDVIVKVRDIESVLVGLAEAYGGKVFVGRGRFVVSGLSDVEGFCDAAREIEGVVEAREERAEDRPQRSQADDTSHFGPGWS